MANKEWLKNGADGLSFGERLGDLISAYKTNAARKTYTATALAKDTGLSQSAISDYLNKDRAPDCATIYTLAKHFSVSADYLLGLSDVSSADLTVQEIHKITGLTEDNINSLTKHGPFGQTEIDSLIDGYTVLSNDLVRFASTHNASRIYSRFLKRVNNPEPPIPEPPEGGRSAIVKFKVVADVISGQTKEGVNYADGYTAVPPNEYSKILLDEFLYELKVYLRNLYFGLDIGELSNGYDRENPRKEW